MLIPQPSEYGTPQPKDEPSAENPPYGVAIDYYVNTDASGPVVIEIADGTGKVIRRVASDDQPTSPDPDTLAVQTVWVPGTTPIPGTRGLHRWVWDFRPTPPAGRGRGGRGGGFGGRGRGAATPPGTYTVRLTVNGKTYTQPLTLVPDPRGGV